MAKKNNNGNGASTNSKRRGRSNNNGNGTSRSSRKRISQNNNGPLSPTPELKTFNGNDQGGLTALSIEQIRSRMGMEQQKASVFSRALGVVVPTDGDDIFMPKPDAQLTVTPARITIDGQRYDMLDSTEFLDSQKMNKLMSQIQTRKLTNSTKPINDYNSFASSDSPNLANNAPMVDFLALKNITLEQKTINNNAGSQALSSNPVDNFDSSVTAITKCLVNHFIDPAEHLGIRTHFLRENLLIEDVTKQDCNNCTIEGLSDIGTIDMSSLNSLTIGNEVAALATQLISGGSGNLKENLFDDESDIPLQMGALSVFGRVSSDPITPSGEVSDDPPIGGEDSSSSSIAPSVVLYYSSIQYIDVFAGYQVSDTGDKMMKYPIYTPLTTDLIASIETIGMPVLCRFRPYSTVEFSSPNPDYVPIQDALPMFNSCFLIAPGELAGYGAMVNPAVEIGLFTERCEYYYFDDDGMSQDYSGYYHVHYDGTVMSEPNHNPSMYHYTLYSYSDGPHPMGTPPAKPIGCEPTGADIVIAEGSGVTNGDTDDDNGGMTTLNTFIDTIDQGISNFYFDDGEVKGSDFTIDEVLRGDLGETQSEFGGNGSSEMDSPGGPTGGGGVPGAY